MLYQRLVEEHLNRKEAILIDENQSFSFQEIHEKTAQYCAVFQNMDIKRGDRILVSDEDPVEFVFVLLACIAMGYTCVPVNGALDAASREQIIHDCKPACIVDEKVKRLAQQIPKPASEGLKDRERCGETTRVYILYTSGSEGVPKGVVASQKRIFFCCRAIQKRLNNTEQDRILCCLPLSFDYGLYQIFLAFFSGARIYLCKGNVLQRIPFLLEKWKITAFPTIPTTARLLVRAGLLRDLGHTELRYMTFTGETLPVSLIKELQALCPGVRIVPMYGMTECKRVSVMPEGWEDKVAAGSCGRPLDGVRVWLESVDADTGIGELVVAGDNVMEGYWNIPDSATGCFSTDPETGVRVLRTGDLLRIDEEGFLYFCGRKNGIVKIRGYRVNTQSVENRLQGIEEITELAVAGAEDPVTGEHLEIWIGSSPQDRKNEIERMVEKRMKTLPEYAQNYRIHISEDPLPRNRNGKTDRRKLQEAANKHEIPWK